MKRLKQYYMTVFSAVYSHCGYYLAAGNTYGDIAVFNLAPFLDCEDDAQPGEKHKHPVFRFPAHNSPIYSLVSTRKLIISGSVGEISAWKWNDVKKKEKKPVWSLVIPQEDSLTRPEVNGIAVAKDDETHIYAGCGDNKLYCLDAEKGQIKSVFSGHTDYIHCVAVGTSGLECVTGSEDGTVRIWDTRKGGKAASIIEPYKHELSTRPQFGKWIGCVAYDDSDDWLVCGGGPALSIWHLRSLAPATCLSKADSTSHVVHFYDGTVISGGSDPCINHWSFSGEVIAEVPTSSSSVFGIDISCSSSKKGLCASGTSHQIDICSDFRFKDFSLSFSLT